VASVVAEELFRAVTLSGVVAFLVWEAATHRDLSNVRGWRLILAGFALLLFASVLDITDNFPALDWLLVVGDTPLEAFLEKIPGYLGGFLLVAFGLVRWMPDVRRLQREIAARRDAEQRTEEQRAFLQSVIDGISEPLMVINLDYQVLLTNRSCAAGAQRPGRPPGALTCHWLKHRSERPCNEKNELCPLREVQRSGRPVTVVHNHPDIDGKPRLVELLASPYHDRDGHLIGIIETARDITEQVNLEARLRDRDRRVHQLANHDPLTGLPNGNFFLRRLREALSASPYLAVLAIDIDRFKRINQGLGRRAGDDLLRAVGARLHAVLRADDILARIDGDDFLVATGRLIQVEHVALLAEELLRTFSKAFTVTEQTLYLSASIGVALCSDDGRDVETLISHAEAASHRAFEAGGNRVQYFSADMSEGAREQMLLEAGLREAIDHDQLILYFQPQVEIGSGRIIGAEALVRWQHPKFGLVAPGKFIPLAERSGLIVPLSDWVLRGACVQAREWHETGRIEGRIAVNLSGRLFDQADLAERIAAILRDTGCPAAALELEITESVMMHEPKQVTEILRRLRALGLSVAIDDFGTGYSSMSRLRRLPIDTLKIDRCFVRDLPADPDAVAITRTIIALAANLHLEIIAEGIETAAQEKFLRAAGCREGQGFRYGRPMPGKRLSALLPRDREVPSCAAR